MLSERWIVLEAQTFDDNNVSTIVTAHETVEQAQSEFYSKLAVAVTSEVPVHSVSLLNNEGNLLESRCFSHQTQ